MLEHRAAPIVPGSHVIVVEAVAIDQVQRILICAAAPVQPMPATTAKMQNLAH